MGRGQQRGGGFIGRGGAKLKLMLTWVYDGVLILLLDMGAAVVLVRADLMAIICGMVVSSPKVVDGSTCGRNANEATRSHG
jgi:hypothetical protein